MILTFALRRELERFVALLGNRYGAAQLRRKEAALIEELGREAWRLQRQHEGLERLQANLHALEENTRQCNRDVGELESRIFEEDPASAERRLREHGARLRAMKAKLLALQARMDDALRAYGRELDRIRPYDHALRRYFDELDQVRAQSIEQQERFKRIRWRLLTGMPLALVELALIVGLVGVGAYILYEHTLKAEVVFTDHFDKRFVNWYTYSDALVEMSVRGGHFTVKGKKDEVSFKTWCYSDVPENWFRFDAKVWIVKGNGPAGLVFRYNSSTDDYYVFEVSGDGRYRISVYANKSWRHLTDWKALPNLRVQEEWVAIGVECDGYNISVFAGAKRLERIKDETLRVGKIGFYVYGKTTAEFDDVVVTARKSRFEKSD